MNQDVSRVVFPLQDMHKEGYLLGFNQNGLNINVIYIDQLNTLTQIDSLLDHSRLHSLRPLSNGELVLIGRISNQNKTPNEPLHQKKIKESNIWINIQNDPDQPEVFQIKELFIYGYRYKTKAQVIFYDTKDNGLLSANPYQVQQLFFDHHLIPLLRHSHTSNHIDEYLNITLSTENVLQNDFDINTLQCLIDIPISDKSDKSKAIIGNELKELEITIRQVNLRKVYQQVYLNTPQPGISYLYQQHQTTILQSFIRAFLLFVFINQTISLLFFKAFARLPLFKAFKRQIQWKTQTVNQLVPLLLLLTHQKQSRLYSSYLRLYLRLMSVITFLLLDSLVGFVSILFMYNNLQRVLQFVHKYGETIHLHFLKQEIEWLMGFPLGLKTNKNLSKVLGQILYLIIYLWNYYTTLATPFEHVLIIMLCGLGVLGFSLVIAFTQDLLSLLTLHVYFIYDVIRRIYSLSVGMLMTLSRVFLNQALNAHTQKKEQHAFTWDQKVISLLIFVVMFSLMPTLAMYYFWFLLINLVIQAVTLFLTYLLRFINYLPLFNLFYYTFCTNKFPKIIYFKKKKNNKEQLQLQTKGIGVSSMVKQFILKMKSQKSPLDLPQLLPSLLCGTTPVCWEQEQVSIQATPSLSKVYQDYHTCINKI